MPFREIKQLDGFIRIKKDGAVVISSSLIPKFFKKKTHVKIYHDENLNKIGLQPSTDGYKITRNIGCFRVKCVMLSRITQGEFYPTWSKKFGMLIFYYGSK